MSNDLKTYEGLYAAFGDVEEYFAEDEVASRREDWEDSRIGVAELLSEYAAGKAGPEAFRQAREIESQWGDDPLCQRFVVEYPELASLAMNGCD